MVLFLPEINFMLLKERFKSGQNCTASENQPLGTPEVADIQNSAKKKSLKLKLWHIKKSLISRHKYFVYQF